MNRNNRRIFSFVAFSFFFLFQCQEQAAAQAPPLAAARSGVQAVNPRYLRDGDLIFQVGALEERVAGGQGEGGIDLTEAVAESTSGRDGVHYTHVGVVCMEKGEPFVIEASTSGVREVPLNDFVDGSEYRDGRPLVAVARVIDTVAFTPRDAVRRVRKLVGKDYDYYYKPDNGKYYCSELVYECYLMHDGTHLFETVPMSFRDKSGQTSELWKSHFAKLGVEVPEGVEGTNPGDLSKSCRIFFLYRP